MISLSQKLLAIFVWLISVGPINIFPLDFDLSMISFKLLSSLKYSISNETFSKPLLKVQLQNVNKLLMKFSLFLLEKITVIFFKLISAKSL